MGLMLLEADLGGVQLDPYLKEEMKTDFTAIEYQQKIAALEKFPVISSQ